MTKKLGFLFPIALLFLWITASAQSGVVKGRVFDETNQGLEGVSVTIAGQPGGHLTDAKGQFEFEIGEGKYTLVFRRLNYKEAREVIQVAPGATVRVNVKMLEASIMMDTVNIHGDGGNKGVQDPDKVFIERIPLNPAHLSYVTSATGSLEQLLATMGGGASSGNEFSSQYRVRGGNFDENLIYVNDIEVYRPFLIRSGQQEGLGFVNSNMVSEVGFSAGGFQAKYGDKMSSVLDVSYKDPSDFHGSVQAGILNQGFHLEGVIQKKDSVPSPFGQGMVRDRSGRKISWIVGARRFTPSYLLNSLDTQGEYKPAFHDAQLMFHYTPRQNTQYFRVKELKDGSQDTIYLPTEKFKLTGFVHFASNDYQFTPQARETSFGTIQSVIRLRVAFQGQELTTYNTGTAALVAEYRPNVRLKIKHIVSAFQTRENELFDVEGGYFLSDVNTNFGSEDYNAVVFDRGIGTFFKHGRNFLTASVISAEQRGDWFPGREKNYRHKISWGLRYQQQIITDELTEWSGVDSAGYFKLEESYRSQVNLNTGVVKGYLQDHWKLSADLSKRLIFGGRIIYNQLNNQLLLAPRVQFVIDPSSAKPGLKNKNPEEGEGSYSFSNERKYQLRFATGVYHQPILYRPLRAIDGTINPSREAQTSFHFIAGGDYLFRIWNRPFKLWGEAYYKILKNLVPYEVDNVRVRYYPFNHADGVAYGMDTRVTGEFIKGVDSWMSLGLLRTQEKVLELDQGWVPRPSDQRLTFGMFFQDELPINPTYKVNINFVYGSGLRFGPPRIIENRSVFKMPSYQRVDLGFSKMILFKTKEERNGKFGMESLWVAVEIFNLFQRANTVSYTWIKDVYNTQFAVPNYLSTRLLNVRLMAKF